MKKIAFITGITGQDGAYLAEMLLEKNYKVVGGFRRLSTPNFCRLEALGILDKLHLVETDLLDASNLTRIIREVRPSEVYNLGAQSFVAHSFKNPILTGNVTGMGVTNLLEAVRIVDPGIRFYQASTSELFGQAKEFPQNENTPFYPRSPYAVAKLYGHWMTINYRESYNIFGTTGILFNHESPLRGVEFVTRKITDAIARIHHGKQKYFDIGNMDVKRDWGFAKDFVEGMWMMMQADKPDNFVLATNESHSVREWIEVCFQYIGKEILWEGKGEKETGRDSKTGKVLIKVNPEFYRPAEVQFLIGDYSKAKRELGWEPRVKFRELAELMLRSDLENNK
jgi:GDPmannose 4,6-dehydratase